MTPCSLLDDDMTNNILLDLSVKANEDEKVDQEEEKEDIQEEVKEKSYKEEDKEEKEDIQEEVKEISIINSLNSIVKLFIKYINEIIKSGTEPLYNDDIDKS